MRGLPPGYVAVPADRLPTAARVYTELRRRILVGQLTPGTLIAEIDTADEFQVSRTPVRDALRELHSDGLVEEGPRRQSAVIAPSPTMAKEVHLMRTACEVIAVRQAAVEADGPSLDALHLNVIRARRHLTAGDDVELVLDDDDEFHMAIARMAGFPILFDTIRRVRGLVRFVELDRPWTSGDLESALVEHEAIVALLERGDATGAAAALEAHLDTRSEDRPAACGQLTMRAAP